MADHIAAVFWSGFFNWNNLTDQTVIQSGCSKDTWTLGHAFVNTENLAVYAEQQNEWLIADSHIYTQ